MPPPLPLAEPAPEVVSIATAPTPPAPRPVPEPTDAARFAIAEQAPAAPRSKAVSGVEDDEEDEHEEEHTLMRPPTAPLPRDAFRDSLPTESKPSAGVPLGLAVPTEPEPSVGVPLELVIHAPRSVRSRRPLVWGLVAATLCVGAYVGSRAQQSPAGSSPEAPAPASTADNRNEGTPPVPAAAAATQRDDLDPPIGTTYDPDTAAEDDALLSEPARAARKAARAHVPRPVRKDQPEPIAAPAAAEPGAASPPPSAPSAAPAAAASEAPAAPQVTAPDAPSAAPTTAPSASAKAAEPAPEPSARAVEPPSAPSEGATPTPGADPAPPVMDRENPY